jgi:acetyl-CoA carboxylase carboxyltransferase component
MYVAREMVASVSDDRGDWGPLLDDLEARQRAAREMGGAERIGKQHAKGKLTARERVERLFDPGTFVELGALVGTSPRPGVDTIPADGFVAGLGRVDGRPVLAGCEDFTVLGGSIGAAATDKRVRMCQLARQERIPLVFMLDGAGHRLTNRHSGRKPNDLQTLAALSGLVPIVTLVLGPAAGHSALCGPLADFSVMTDDASMFTAGPPLVKAATGENVTKEALGGPQIHVDLSGVAHNVVTDDDDALALCRSYLSYFPPNAWTAPPPAAADAPDTGNRRLDDLLTLIPADDRKPYSMRAVVDRLVDTGSGLEIQPRYGRSIVTTLARLGGRSVAIVANDPGVRAGAIDTDAAEKAAHFLDVADCFHLPVVFLADNPGVLAGTKAEREGALRAAARMFAAQHRLTVPKLHVTLRKAFGFGSSVMAMNPYDDQTILYAFPGVTLGAMPAESGGASAKLDDATQAEVTATQTGGPWPQAHGMGYDDVIDPRDLRDALLRALVLLEARDHREYAPVARRGILP